MNSKDVADGDYVLQLNAAGIEPFKATLHVQSGLPIVQDISLEVNGRHPRKWK